MTAEEEDDLGEQLAALDLRYERALADLDNYRKRSQQEIQRRVAETREALLRDWGIEALEVEAIEPFEHAFTHFTLEVEPWRVRLGKSTRLAEAKAAHWMPLGDPARAALPSPVPKPPQKPLSRTPLPLPPTLFRPAPPPLEESAHA
mgnify:CR=1 FL=1